MNEHALMLYISQILGNQHAIMNYLAQAHTNGDENARAEHLRYMISQGEQFSKVLLPAILTGSNLNWDPNDLLKS